MLSDETLNKLTREQLITRYKHNTKRLEHKTQNYSGLKRHFRIHLRHIRDRIDYLIKHQYSIVILSSRGHK